ncbi:MAG: protein kinase [Proteobacteria bacterium]|nr:protein kinase [Pseudomonadota bacterium]
MTTVLGTPRYMAPEQHLGKPLDPRADQFSFCVALYEALYGHPPFVGTTHAQIVASVVAGELAPVPSDTKVPRAIRDAIVRGLSTDRAKRYPSMHELIVELSSAGEVTPSRTRWIAIVAVVVVGLLAGGVVLYRHSIEERELLTEESRASKAKQQQLEDLRDQALGEQRRRLDEERARNTAEKAKLADEAKALRERAAALDREILALKLKLEPGRRLEQPTTGPKPVYGSGSAKPVVGSLKVAQAHFDAAQKAYLDRQYDTAISEFEAAYAARAFPQFLYNIAAAYQMKAKQTLAQDDFRQAIAFYRRYLVEAPPDEKPKIEKVIAVLESVVNAP